MTGMNKEGWREHTGTLVSDLTWCLYTVHNTKLVVGYNFLIKICSIAT